MSVVGCRLQVAGCRLSVVASFSYHVRIITLNKNFPIFLSPYLPISLSPHLPTPPTLPTLSLIMGIQPDLI
ncbi:MAG: hypothetical protein F6K55_40315 [Moorea sp. SIO4A3]|nr:hypothetical protein [Moorena sp. SIO4A3]